MNSSAPIIRGNSLYTIVDGPSWTEAEANSVKLGGHLTSITSPEEDTYIWSSLEAFGWIGLTDVNQEGSWEWINDEEVSYTNWAPGEPNNATNEDYGFYWKTYPGQWADHRNTNQSAVSSGIAEIPFIRRGDSAYVIVEGPTWDEAEANAVALGGHLVTINDAEENTWITDKYLAPNAQNYFIGATDQDSEGIWSWSNNEGFDYSNWYAGEPNNADGGENYSIISGSSQDADRFGFWNDTKGLTPELGIAEIPLSPNNAPTGTPTLNGDFKVGQTINIDASDIEDADNFEGWTPTYEYSWEISGDNGTTWTALTSADATDGDDSYTLTSAEVGKQLRGVVSYLDGYGTNEVVISEAASPIASLPLAIKGLPHVGQAIEIDSTSIPEGYKVKKAGFEIQYPKGVVNFIHNDFTWSLDSESVYRMHHRDTLLFERDWDTATRFDEYGENTIDVLIGDKSISFAPHLSYGHNAEVPQSGEITGKISALWQVSRENEVPLNETGYTWRQGGVSLTLRPQNLMPPLDVAFAAEPQNIISNNNTYSLISESADAFALDESTRGAKIRANATLISPEGKPEYALSSPVEIKGVIASNSHIDTNSGFTPNNAPQGELLINGEPESGQTLSLDTSSITDEDGINTDIGFTHSWQVYDIDSSSWLNLDTTDATDGDHSLTLTSALIGKELRGRASYTDGNGLTEVMSSSHFTVEAPPIAGPIQQIAFPSTSISYTPGSTLTLPLLYNTGTGDNNLTGLSFNLHYNSSLLTPNTNSANNPVNVLIDSDITSASISPDTDDLDADPLTDQLISLSWLSFSAAFPGTELPAAIAEVSFETAELSSDPITGAPLSTNLNLTATAAGTAANYSFSGSSVTLNPQTFHLDVDGDGQVTAFGDGLMIIRKLLGNAFNGDALTDKAISNAATRSTTEIHQFIQSGIDNRALDIDQDGQVTAFSDGLMLIRSLLGNAFSADALTDKALSSDSPYYNQANAWQSVQANIDALVPEQTLG